MTSPITAEIDHPTLSSPPPRLWEGDELAASTLFTNGSREAASSRAAELASRLVGDSAAEAGLEVLAAAIAVASVQQSALSALLGDLVRRKDLDAARGIAHLLKLAGDRLARLSDAHSAALARGARPLVAVSAGGRAGSIRIVR